MLEDDQQRPPNFGVAPTGAYDRLISTPSPQDNGIAQRIRVFAGRLQWRMLLVLILLAAPFFYAMLSKKAEIPGPPPSNAQAQTARAIPSPFAREALRPLSEKDAQAWNDAQPLAAQNNATAPAFLLPLLDMTDYARSVQCMTMAIYYEAGNEATEGERAVAQVILNRLRHPVYPKTICGVVFEGASRTTGCQFTFACDGSMARTPDPASWSRAKMVASAALAGYVFEPVGMATHYHADYVVPYWAATLDKVATLGAHIFYRWSGQAGLPQAFTGRYVGKEPALSFLDRATEAEKPTAHDTIPMIVEDASRPVIPADFVQTRATQADKPQAVGIEQRWIVPRGDMPLGLPAAETPYNTSPPQPAASH